MTTTSQINLEPISQFCNGIWHALSRPAVSIQILIIIFSLSIGLIIASKIRINIKRLKAPIKPRATAASIALILLTPIYALMEALASPNGLIQHAGTLLLIYIALNILFQSCV